MFFDQGIVVESFEKLEARLLLSGDVGAPASVAIYHINAGGGSIEISDTVWQKDSKLNPTLTNQKESGSQKKRTRKKITETSASVNATTPSKIFKQYRQDRNRGEQMQWDLQITPGRYEVRLYFAETRGRYQSEGARVFDVYLEDKLVLDDYDIFKENGANTGAVKTYLINVDDSLDIDFQSVVGNAMINGIEVIADGVVAEDDTPPIVEPPIVEPPVVDDPQEIEPAFSVFNAMVYGDMPNLIRDGLSRIQAVYHVHLWPAGMAMDQPHIPTIKAYAAKLKTDFPVVINVEHWEIENDDEQSSKNIQKLIDVIDAMKEVNPDLQIGYYRLLPMRNYWASLQPRDSTQYKAWQQVNDRLKVLGKKVDFIAPSLYTFYEDTVGWEKYARESIREAKQYGKPIYPYIWPQYHHGGTYKDNSRPFLPSDVFRNQLEFLKDRVDGTIIWGGWDKNGRMDWNDDIAWYEETKKFMTTL